MKKYSKLVCQILSLIMLMFLLTSCSVRKTSTDHSFYIKVNDELLSKEYIGYFFSLAQETMLSEAGYNDENSTEEDISTYWATTELEGKNAVEVARDVAVDNAVLQKISYQRAVTEGITLTDEEKEGINADLEFVAKNNGGQNGFAKKLAERGTDIVAYKQILTENLYMEKLFEKYDSEGLLAVTDDELVAFSDANAEKYSPDSMLYEMKKQKFTKISEQWERDAEIVIDEEKIKEFNV